jgi:hypothetical protein
MPIDDDPFCEQRFWMQYSGGAPVEEWVVPMKNPICALTGFGMSVIGLLPHGWRVPPLFSMCQASLALLSASTVLFHSLTPSQAGTLSLSYRLCDWFSMALLGCCMDSLYLSHLVPAGARVWALAIVFLWMGVVVIENDSITFDRWMDSMGAMGGRNDFDTVMSALVLVPMGVVLAWALVARVPWQRAVWLWVWLGLSIVLWLTNAYGCKEMNALFILHALYHVTVAMLIMQGACIGVGLDEARWEVQAGFWPMIRERGVEGGGGVVAPAALMPRITKMA